jgi:hypothetical protein
MPADRSTTYRPTGDSPRGTAKHRLVLLAIWCGFAAVLAYVVVELSRPYDFTTPALVSTIPEPVAADAAGERPDPDTTITAGESLEEAPAGVALAAYRKTALERSTKAEAGAPTRTWTSARQIEPEEPEPVGHFEISGHVYDDFGVPVPGIELTVSRRGLSHIDTQAPGEPESRIPSAFTSFDGFYFFTDLLEGEYAVSTTATDRYTSAATVVRAGSHTADLSVSERMDVRVHGVITSTDGKPLGGVTVTPVFTALRPIFSDQRGRYDLVVPVQLFGRNHNIRFHHGRYYDEVQSLGDLSGLYESGHEVPEIELDITMRPILELATVNGRLLDTNGAPVADEKVQLYSPALKRRYSAVSNSEGEFAIANVAAAKDYYVRVYPASTYRDYEQRRFEVSARGATLEVVLSNLDFGRVAGRMVDVEGHPIPDFTLWLRSGSSVRQWMPVKGDTKGNFSVEDVPSGQLVLRTLSVPNFNILGPRLSPGGEKEVDVVLDRGRHEFYGRVENIYGDPVTTADVFLYWAHQQNEVKSHSTRRASADASGNFKFSGIGPGSHTLSVSAPGFITARVDYDVGKLFIGEVVVRLQESTP